MVFLNVPSFEVLLPAALGSQLGTGQPLPGVCSANLPQYNHDRDHVKKIFCTAAEFLNCNKSCHILCKSASPKVSSAGGTTWVDGVSS